MSEEEISIEAETLMALETGAVVEATIKDIIRGKCKEFPAVQKIRNEQIRQRWEQTGDAECIQLTVDVDGIEYILFPIKISNNPRSTYYRLLKKYGEKKDGKISLKKGSKIKIIITERGFPRPYLE